MASFIRPNRTEVSRTFPWLGFTIRTTAPAWFEVAIATDPRLFDGAAKSRRISLRSTRHAGLDRCRRRAARPSRTAAVLARFAGSPNLDYALAAFRGADRQRPEIVMAPATAAPSVALSRSFTGVTRRLAGVGGRSGDSGPDYGSANGAGSLDWAGDTALAPAPAHPEPGSTAAAPAHASALEFEYRDGFGPMPPDQRTEHGHHRFPSQALGDAIDVYWDDVELVGQPTDVSCWAAAAAMVVGWRDRVSINPEEFARFEGRWAEYNRRGLSTNDNDEFAAAWRLEVEPPMDPSVEFFGRLLQTKGPLWIGRHPMGNAPNSGHAVAVIGLHGDGTPDGTYVHWNDPWPPGQGAANRTETYTTFLQEFDDFVTVDPQGHVNNQILHAADTGGRTPGHAPATAAQALGPPRSGRPALRVRLSAGHAVDRDLGRSDDDARGGDGMKYPPGVTGGGAGASPKRLTIAGPRYAAFGVDNIYANIDVDFEFDGRGVGKVAMRMGEHSDAITKGLNVTAHIVDDARTFQGPSGQTFAGIRITIDYAMTQVVADDVQAQIDVMLYGNGDYDVRYHMVQGSFDTMPGDTVSGVAAAATPARAQSIAMSGGGAAAAVASEAAGNIAGVAVQRAIENVGDLTIAHESWNGMKYPPGVQRGNTATVPKQITIQSPRYDAFYVDSIYSDLTVDFEYDGRGVGKVVTRGGARSDAVGKGLVVDAHIVDDRGRSRAAPAGGRRPSPASGSRSSTRSLRSWPTTSSSRPRRCCTATATTTSRTRSSRARSTRCRRASRQACGRRRHRRCRSRRSRWARGPRRPSKPRSRSRASTSTGCSWTTATTSRRRSTSGRATATARGLHRRSTPGRRQSQRQRRDGSARHPHGRRPRDGPALDQRHLLRARVLVGLQRQLAHERQRREGPSQRAGHQRRDTARPGSSQRRAGRVRSHRARDAFGALRYNISWEYHRTLHADIVVHATVMLYGDGSSNVKYEVLQGNVDVIRQNPWNLVSGYDIVSLPQQPSSAQSLGEDGNGGGGSAVAAIGREAASQVVERVVGYAFDRLVGDSDNIETRLDQWPGASDRTGPAPKKFPHDDPSMGGYGGTNRATATIASPRTTINLLDDLYCDLIFSWDYNGSWLTNVDVQRGQRNGPGVSTGTMHVHAIGHDVPGAFVRSGDPFAALRYAVSWEYHRTTHQDIVVYADVRLYGDGTCEVRYSHVQGSVDHMPDDVVNAPSVLGRRSRRPRGSRRRRRLPSRTARRRAARSASSSTSTPG